MKAKRGCTPLSAGCFLFISTVTCKSTQKMGTKVTVQRSSGDRRRGRSYTQIMYGSNRKQSVAPPRPLYKYENDLVEEEEEDDLYEVPPCDRQCRSLPCLRTAQENHSTYLGHSAAVLPPQKPPVPDRIQQGPWQQRPPPKQTRPAPPAKRGPPIALPLPDRRMSLPCTAMHTPPPSNNNFSKGMDDLYLTVLNSQTDTRSDVTTGGEGKHNQRPEDLGLMGQPWYAGEMERREAERALRRINKDGCFLVRLSSSQNQTQLYTLAVLFHDHIYNIPIRAVGNDGFSLGKEGKRYEEIKTDEILTKR
ncbi:SH2 domain-containing protein 6 isoform X2 [Dendrobates tinctorius]|uniref:SH2 domain-containing protein 6 isoform X2 n=1 Tax=Dendrobates tinctorius TaxID=92724 RepID=UPI003CC9F9D5